MKNIYMKILKILLENSNLEMSKVVLKNKNIRYYLYFKNLDKYFTINIGIWGIYTSIITFFVFIIFWYFEIEVLTESQVEFIRLYKYIMFYIVIIYVIISFFITCYNYYFNSDIESLSNLYDKFFIILSFINFIVMLKVIMCVFDISFELYTQYNIWYLIYTLYRTFLILIGKKSENEKIISYSSYPWILILIALFLIYIINNIIENEELKDTFYLYLVCFDRKYLLLKKKNFWIKVDLDKLFKKEN